jgi:hypothetical protein
MYTNKVFGVSFRYPPDWQISEGEESVNLVKDPDFRPVVSACPGYSFIVSVFDKNVDYSSYAPVERISFKGEPADYSIKTNAYGCVTSVYFINQFPSEHARSRLVIMLRQRAENSVELFNQILSTFKFLE